MEEAMPNISSIREHMEVVDEADMHVGTVDRVEGARVKLTRTDPLAEGAHHFVDFGWIDRVDTKVHLNKPNSELLSLWKSK
jgi:hypothetical protein